MERERIFPAVITEESNGTYYGIAGLQLESILKAELAKKEQLLFYQGYSGDENRRYPGMTTAALNRCCRQCQAGLPTPPLNC